ncbi:MAG TPA: indole-3-glycerol phosphate synthase TrpC [Gemmatimonadaceae bacterium]|nr:indole-3-glycerol phosphate synthase TrpC [Gemmatimonadaceae bacterium]
MTDEAHKRAATLKARETELWRSAEGVGPVAKFGAALRQATVSVIAEVKRSSPSKGAINPDLAVKDQVVAYERGGAAAISILTEPTRFSGSNDDLTAAGAATKLPLLKKDFHVDPVQIVEAKSLGASAALVIVKAVPPTRLRELLDAGRSVGIDLVIEVRDEKELQLALAFGAEIIGINNRDLETLAIDSTTAPRLLPLVPKDVVAIAESGMKSADDVQRVADAGADAVLIGSELSAAADPEKALRVFNSVKRSGDARQG